MTKAFRLIGTIIIAERKTHSNSSVSVSNPRDRRGSVSQINFFKPKMAVKSVKQRVKKNKKLGV